MGERLYNAVRERKEYNLAPFFPNQLREVPEVIMSSVFVLSACVVVLIGLAVIAAEEPFK